MILKDTLDTFTRNNPRKHILAKNYDKAFKDIAQAILSGYFEVSKGNTPIKFIRPTKVEFYYHEEYTDKENIENERVDDELKQLYNDGETCDETLLIKDYIVYHRNTIKDTHVPLFKIGTLNNHQSGIDITFEHKIEVNGKEVYVRAAALIRGFYVYTNRKECEDGLPIPAKYKDDVHLKYPEDRCTYLYNQLYGDSAIYEDGFTVKWIDSKGTIEPAQAPRVNVRQYTNEKIKKIQKTTIPDNRDFQFFNPQHYLDEFSIKHIE